MGRLNNDLLKYLCLSLKTCKWIILHGSSNCEKYASLGQVSILDDVDSLTVKEGIRCGRFSLNLERCA